MEKWTLDLQAGEFIRHNGAWAKIVSIGTGTIDVDQKIRWVRLESARVPGLLDTEFLHADDTYEVMS